MICLILKQQQEELTVFYYFYSIFLDRSLSTYVSSNQQFLLSVQYVSTYISLVSSAVTYSRPCTIILSFFYSALDCNCAIQLTLINLVLDMLLQHIRTILFAVTLFYLLRYFPYFTFLWCNIPDICFPMLLGTSCLFYQNTFFACAILIFSLCLLRLSSLL